MTTGHLGKEALQSAISLDDALKNKIADYERSQWAANISLPDIKDNWRTFLSKLESAIKHDDLNDIMLTQLITHLATIDTVLLLEQIGKLDPARQDRFITLLNWIADHGPDPMQQENASQVKERILMTYRLKMFPTIFSKDRIERAIHLLKKN